jgi:hypothetical protein
MTRLRGARAPRPDAVAPATVRPSQCRVIGFSDRALDKHTNQSV